MKVKKKIKHIVELILLKFIINLLRLIPLKINLYLGSRLGKFLYKINKKHRQRAFYNLKCSFPDKSEEELSIILENVYINLCKTFVEFLDLNHYKKKYIAKRITIQGKEHLDNALKLKKGILGITAHIDNWELLGAVLTYYGYPLDVLYHPMRNPYTDKLFNKNRNKAGIDLISYKNSLRSCLKSLNNNHILGLIADQDAGRDGIFVNFFGRPASTAQGPGYFAIKTDAPALFINLIRQNNDHHVLHISPPLKMKKEGDFKENLYYNTKLWSDEVEAWVKKYPEQWFWVHRKWHSKPT